MTTAWSRVKVVGPLAPYAERFGRELVGRGYTDLSTAEQLRLMGHLSRWMVGKEIDVAVLSGEQVEQYCTARRAQGYTARLAPTALRWLAGVPATRAVGGRAWRKPERATAGPL